MATAFPDVPAWPEGPPPQGHNRPPVEEDVKAQFREALLEDRPDFLTRFDAIEAAAGRVAVTDEETLGKAGDLIKMMRAAAQHVAAAHERVKKPYLAAGRVADAEKNALTARLDAARKTAEAPMNAFVAERKAQRRAEEARLREEQRLQAEEAAKRQAEIEAAAAAGDEARLAEVAPIAEPVVIPQREPVRSAAGTAVSGRTVWNVRVDDYDIAYMQVSDDGKVRESIDKAIAARVRAGARKLEGCTVWNTVAAVAR